MSLSINSSNYEVYSTTLCSMTTREALWSARAQNASKLISNIFLGIFWVFTSQGLHICTTV